MNVSVIEKNKCFGCSACVQSCSKNAITMAMDKEGFLFPSVNKQKCTDCSLCLKKCPSYSPAKWQNYEQKVYAAVYKNDEICKKSASGGAFSAFAKNILEKNGTVFGCAYDKDLNAIQVKIDSLSELEKLQGSKYVFSDVKNTFYEVKKILESGKNVLYSGRPCQIAGLLKFLGKDYENLLTVDLVCHGVPSQLLFTKYLEWLGKKNSGKIIYYGFRDKDVCGWSCGGKIKTKTKTKTIEASCDPYYASFLRGETYRLSCYECPFACTSRVSDISICDFWGIENFYPDFDTSNGVSGIILNSKKGRLFFETCQSNFNLKEAMMDELKAFNTNLNHPTKMPQKRKTVYEDCLVGGKFVPKVEYFSPIKLWVTRTLSKIIPGKIKKIIKKLLGKI